MNSTPQILDPCCGGKMLWFNKNDRRAAFCDRRREKHILCDGRFFEVNPDTVCDFRKLPFPDESFFLICFDPPHLLQAGETSWIKKKYGSLNRLTWSEDLSKGFDECWRVLKPGGTLIFKWNETQISLREVLSCFSRRPVFGHTTTKHRGGDRFCRGRGFCIGRERRCVARGYVEKLTGIFSARFCIV